MYCSRRHSSKTLSVKIVHNGKIRKYYLGNSSRENDTRLSFTNDNQEFTKYMVLYPEDYQNVMYRSNYKNLDDCGASFKLGDTVKCHGWTITLDSQFSFEKLIYNLETEIALV